MSNRLYIAVLLGIAAAMALALFLIGHGEPEPDSVNQAVTPTRAADPTAPVGVPEVDADPPEAVHAPPVGSHGPPPQGATPGPPTSVPKDEASPAPAKESEWTDPVNAQVLGHKEWMAPDSPEEAARVDEVFERARAARYDPRLSNQGREASMAAARQVVDRCFDALREQAPTARGRIIVAWTSGADGGRGWFRKPRITANIDLRDPAFEGCILSGLSGLSFAADDGEPIEVEAPFFFGDEP